MAAIADDDRMLDSLGSAVPVALDQLAALLLNARRGAEVPPMPVMVETATALVVIARSVRRRLFVRCAVSVAMTTFVAAVLIGLGLFIAPAASWWWAVPVLGLSGLGGTYLVVWSMRPAPEWKTSELDDEEKP